MVRWIGGLILVLLIAAGVWFHASANPALATVTARPYVHGTVHLLATSNWQRGNVYAYAVQRRIHHQLNWWFSVVVTRNSCVLVLCTITDATGAEVAWDRYPAGAVSVSGAMNDALPGQKPHGFQWTVSYSHAHLHAHVLEGAIEVP